MELKYLYPLKPNLPPFDIIDDDDFEAFKFVNLQSKNTIWPIELYASLKERGVEEVANKEEAIASPNSTIDITVSLSPPPLTQSQDASEVVLGAKQSKNGIESDMTNVVGDMCSTGIVTNIIDCDMYERKPSIQYADIEITKPDIIHVEGDKQGKAQVIDLGSDSEVELIAEEREMRCFTGRKRGHESIDIDVGDTVEVHYEEDNGFDFEKDSGDGLKGDCRDDYEEDCGDDFEEDRREGEFEEPLLDDGNMVDDLFFDVDEEVLQEMEAEYYKKTKFSHGQMNDVEEVGGDSVGEQTNFGIKVGDYFDSKKDLKDHFALMEIHRRFQFRVLKSDKSLYVVKCIESSCTFFCHGIKFGEIDLFLVKKYCDEHTCGMKVNHNHHVHASSSIIADQLMSR